MKYAVGWLMLKPALLCMHSCPTAYVIEHFNRALKNVFTNGWAMTNFESLYLKDYAADLLEILSERSLHGWFAVQNHRQQKFSLHRNLKSVKNLKWLWHLQTYMNTLYSSSKCVSICTVQFIINKQKNIMDPRIEVSMKWKINFQQTVSFERTIKIINTNVWQTFHIPLRSWDI